VSVESLMVYEVTLRSLADADRDPIGGVIPLYDEESTTMYLEPGHGSRGAFTSGREDMTDRNTPIGDWFGVGLASVSWDSWQQIVWESHTFDIIAPPRPFGNPREGGETSHVELSLQEVT